MYRRPIVDQCHLERGIYGNDLSWFRSEIYQHQTWSCLTWDAGACCQSLAIDCYGQYFHRSHLRIRHLHRYVSPLLFSLAAPLMPSSDDRNYAMRLPPYPPTTTFNPRSIHWRFLINLLVSPRIPLANNPSFPAWFRTPFPWVHHEPPRQSYYIRMG